MTGLVTDLWVNTDEWIPSAAGNSGSEKLDASQAELPNLQPRSQQEASDRIDHRYNQQEIKRVHFAVGLWTVCPSHPDNHLLKGSGSDSNPRNYQESSYPCSSISISRILDTSDLSWRQELGLWSPAYNTFRIIDNIRICALFAISSLALMIISTFLATLGHCVRGHKMLLASGLYALGGLLLGCCLLILVCTISEEFGPANSRTKLSSSSSVLKSESRSYLQRQNPPISSGQTKDEYTSGDQYSYGWSFILATLGFLGSELSALLCLAAFLNRFDSEEDFIKMLPGMERRLTEHMMVHQQASEIASGRSLQEVPLLKGSFGHHSATTGNSSSQESLYGASSSQQGQNKILTSGSLHSLRAAKQIPVTAEIVPMPLTERGDRGGGGSVILANSASSGAITSSSFMPENSLGCSLGHRSAQQAPPSSNLENGYVQHMMSVNSRLSSSPVLVDTHVRSTMPRNMHVNGNEWNCEDPSTPPPPPPPHGSALALHGSSHGNSLSATLPVKKKSVTIGTFTTVVEPFEIDHSNHHHDSHVNESMMTSAV